ncbi:MAG: UMP kinase [bacterium]|uniref:Uridylate kinase n=2 Tax=Bacteria candidate phyla TaxID=1783234 RepID=A0A117M6M1_UNCT6|nr:MAG: Uridylate kinase [candidate division TA06 bacterium 32_111]KUK87279.1 MAG: Uridylate kinase [candidate division TA06 bacterium 34_109]MDI6700463.1 UMP kinase [bacterium]HAF07587.1 UMP kinase [candidate division WOR-3 bacterium]HCP16138.1 UMP kinase [candidate division WOR-3 bacterium]
MKVKPKYKRILLKLSGEILGDRNYVFSEKSLSTLVKEIVEVYRMGVDIGIVIGGGNIVRGSKLVDQLHLDKVTADYTGMLSTVINGMVLQSMIEKKGINTRMMTAIEIKQIAEPYIRRKALSHLDKKRIVIFTGGTGNPFFTTDTAAVLRASEIGCEVLLKGTKVDGVFDLDPVKNKNAKMFKNINYSSVLIKELNVMDMTAISLSRENKLPIIVFNILKYGNLIEIVKGKKIGTLVS